MYSADGQHYWPPRRAGVEGLGQLELEPVGGRLGLPTGGRLPEPKALGEFGVNGCALDAPAGLTLPDDIGALKPLLGCAEPKPGLKPVPELPEAGMVLVGMLLDGMPPGMLLEPPNELAPDGNCAGRLVLAYGLAPGMEVLLIPPVGNCGCGAGRVLLHPHKSIPPTSKAPIFRQDFDPIPFLLTP